MNLHKKLYLHNTATGRKEPFEPLDPQRVTMYVCGPTVYNLVHIGNGRPAVVFDVLYRLLRATYPKVLYARNITDVDDKINAAAAASGESIATLTERYTEQYRADVAGLLTLPPDIEPRATHHIEDIISMIQTLIERGHAYAADGHVLFHVPSHPDYGTLSRRSLEDMMDGARVEVAPYKRDPKDFVLWKPSSPELPGWDSPWGRGRPGWHIECSAMIRRHLGPVIDIHGGGSDLIFPHHENERAQSCCAGDAPFVRYWLHNGMLTLGNEKMAKSVGNVRTIHTLLHEHHGETLRYALLKGHYRSPLAWSDDLITEARRSLDRLYQALRDVPAGNLQRPDQLSAAGIEQFPAALTDALADDLNTPEALAALHSLVSDIRHAGSDADRVMLRDQLLAGGWLLGLLNEDPEAWFQTGPGTAADLSSRDIELLIAERSAAKKGRDFVRADAIRDQLADSGVELEDTRDGTRWRFRDGG